MPGIFGAVSANRGIYRELIAEFSAPWDSSWELEYVSGDVGVQSRTFGIRQGALSI